MVIALLVIAACGGETKTPDDILPRDEFRDVLMDLHLAEAQAMDQSRDKDSTQVQLKADYLFIFGQYGIDKEAFFRSFDYYSDHPRELHQIYEEIHARLNILQDSLLHKEQIGRPEGSDS